MDENRRFPTIVMKFADGHSDTLSEAEYDKVGIYLEDNYYHDPSSEALTHLLIRYYNERKHYLDAKEIGQAFLTDNGYSKAILGELSTTYLATDEMDTYFTLVRKYVAEEKIVQAEQATVIPFPRKRLTASSEEMYSSFLDWNIAEQLQFLQNVRFEKIDSYIADFRLLLKTETISPFVQSIIFEILQENHIDENITVQKLGRQAVFNPVKTPIMEENPFIQTFFSILKESLENDNPSLLMQVTDIVQQHLFLLYPFSLEPEEPTLWAQAYYNWISTMYHTQPIKRIAETEELERAQQFIEQLEEAQQKNLS